jgi:hypothetical protein
MKVFVTTKITMVFYRGPWFSVQQYNLKMKQQKQEGL